MSFSYLEKFVTALQEQNQKKEELFDQTITGTIRRVQKELLDESFLPSMSLKKLFDKLLRRSRYPMEIAISGQFSSGKSTFLNALLQKDILPTGITPVTSKVNFINYGTKFRLKATYYSGHEAFHPIEDIAIFTDQRQDVQNVKYLTLYAPMEILKDLSFVDTPGLNSLSQSDTTTTEKVLRDVDGIIWLTLMDNAGKESEAEVLQKYMSHFSQKSLCVLNQKDKFTQKEIDTTTAYVKETFSDYFSKVIPISAKQALESRQYQKKILIDDEIRKLSQRFKKSLPEHFDAKNLDFFKKDFQHYQELIKQIQDKDSSDDIKKQEASNILEVIDFIEDVIRPQAITAKAFSIKEDLRSICDILIKEYQTILSVFETLDEIHQNGIVTMKLQLKDLLSQQNHELFVIQENLQAIINTMAHEIFINIKPFSKQRFEPSKSLFTKSTKYSAINYEALKIDQEAILKNLFFDDQTIDKKINRSMKLLQELEDDTATTLRTIFFTLKVSVEKWRSTYEYLDKQREISSDLEFANTRNFVARVYENFLSYYHANNEETVAVMKKNFAHLKGSIAFNYRQVTQATIAFFETKINQSLNSYEKDPTQFNIYRPNEDEILERLYESFSMDKIVNYLTSSHSHMHNIITYAEEELDFILKERTEFLKKEQQAIHDKIKKVQKIQSNIL